MKEKSSQDLWWKNMLISWLEKTFRKHGGTEGGCLYHIWWYHSCIVHNMLDAGATHVQPYTLFLFVTCPILPNKFYSWYFSVELDFILFSWLIYYLHILVILYVFLPFCLFWVRKKLYWLLRNQVAILWNQWLPSMGNLYMPHYQVCRTLRQLCEFMRTHILLSLLTTWNLTSRSDFDTCFCSFIINDIYKNRSLV